MKIGQFITTLATIFIYAFCSSISFAQMSIEQRNLKVDILRLREYSIAYDANRIAENPDKGKREMIIKKYKDQINLIKNGSDRERYIKFLSNAVGVDSSKYAKEIGYNYTYYNPLLTHNRRMMPTMLEYFKVVRYSLFELNKEELVHPDQIPFLKEKQKNQRFRN